MKKWLFLGLGCLLFLALAGCGSETTGDANQGAQSEEESVPDIEGYVMAKDEMERILVVSSSSQDFSDHGGDEEFYNAMWVADVVPKVEIGQKVRVWLAGPVLESYPAQGGAEEVTILPDHQPEGADLSEAQAIRKALEQQPDAETWAIKEIAYDKDSDTWEILFYGILSNTETNIEVKDE